MKNMVKKFSFVFVVLFVIALASCYEPNPLYGTWKDNSGNKITFINDGTYSAKIYDPTTGVGTDYEGTFSLIDNIIQFGTANGSVISEWDIRGSILYCKWGNNLLTLYQTSK